LLMNGELGILHDKSKTADETDRFIY
jgi:hypothetical protein